MHVASLLQFRERQVCRKIGSDMLLKPSFDPEKSAGFGEHSSMHKTPGVRFPLRPQHPNEPVLGM